MDHKAIRQRTVEEDTLLGSRTTAFLIGNGFVLTALGSNKDMPYSWGIAIFGLILSLVWILTTVQSHRVIQSLHKLRLNLDTPDIINDAVSATTFWKPGYFRTLLGPTALIAIWLPFVVVVLWVFINVIRHFYS